MQKKLFAIFAIMVAIVFSFSVCFAADMLTDATNAVRDTVTNAGNAVEDTMQNAGNAVQGAMNTAGDAMQDSMDKTENTMENAGNTIEDTGNTLEKDMKNTTSRVTNTNNDGYTATRTATNGKATFMGMSATAWTWLILGISGIAIIAVVWYYSTQITSENNHSRRD